MNLEMVKVELLKLRRRRGLFWWSLLLTVGVPLVFFTIVEVLHLTSPEKYAAVGSSPVCRSANTNEATLPAAITASSSARAWPREIMRPPTVSTSRMASGQTR